MLYEFTLRDGSKFAVPAEVFDAVAKRKVEAADLRDQVDSLKQQLGRYKKDIEKLIVWVENGHKTKALDLLSQMSIR